MNPEENKNKSPIAEKEEKQLEYWKKDQTFEKSLAKKSPKGEYVFYDGPPFATGTPHYGHILASVVKDMIPRFKTMQGYHVLRRWGWDTHGLPIENIVEKDLGVSGRKKIEELGVKKFNEYARSKVMSYADVWNKTVERIARWVDFDGSYKTLDNTYIESVWWALGELNKKKLLYEGTRVLPFCPRCETPISNSEIAMDNSYKDLKDISVYVLFRLLGKKGNVPHKDTYILAWTTTPWTLPGNFALAIKADLMYSEVIAKKEDKEVRIILAKDRIEELLVKKGYEIEFVREFLGETLVGEAYQPIFNYFVESINSNPGDAHNAWKIYAGDFVTADTGTGVVHISPGYGEDDMSLAKKHNIPWRHHVNRDGTFTEAVIDFALKKVKPKPVNVGDHQVTDIEIVKFLAHNHNLFAKENIVHSYPHCHRCETPLFYFAIPAWFFNIAKIKKDLISGNQKINWVPGHLKDGRFLKGLESAPDWNISRNRFWASPLPIWKCDKTGQVEFISSLSDLQDKIDRKNKIYLMRHGKALNNIQDIVSSALDQKYPLTDAGREGVLLAVKKHLKKLKINHIYFSDIYRTKETAKIVAEALGLSSEQIHEDKRLRETDFGELEGKTLEEYHSYQKQFGSYANFFDKEVEGGESLLSLKRRLGDFLFEIYNKHKGENILVVSHSTPLWLLTALEKGLNTEEAVRLKEDSVHPHYYFDNAEVRPLNFRPYPHNDDYVLDFHRPYIDDFSYPSRTGGGTMRRIPEVIDCWFESGAMPFAAEHYPMENTKKFKKNFPADFVCEYLPQTRTWFYYMHVLGTVLFGHAPFRNVVTTGTVLAEDGQKMSKSKNNFPDPWLVFDKYGVDALRYYLVASPLMRSEDFSFSEKDLDTIYKKLVMRMENVVTFYKLSLVGNVDKVLVNKIRDPKYFTENVLDKWIVNRLHSSVYEIEKYLEIYEIDTALRPYDQFIDDLSTWYIRRSRDRLKNDVNARETLRYVLHVFARAIAPIMPFLAERIYTEVRFEGDPESVHLASWPSSKKPDAKSKKLDQEMLDARNFISKVLDVRTKSGIKVRQPLGSLTVEKNNIANNPLYKDIVLDELNIKKIIVAETNTGDFVLDTKLTDDLVLEGKYRDLVRIIQDKRKETGLVPEDIIEVVLPSSEDSIAIVKKFETEFTRVVNAKSIKVDQANSVVNINVIHDLHN